MAGIVRVELNHDGIAELLKSAELAAEVGNLAEAIAGTVRSQKPDAEVVVDNYTTDRAAAAVTVKDARARLWEARDGLLSRAAAGQGLVVKAKR